MPASLATIRMSSSAMMLRDDVKAHVPAHKLREALLARTSRTSVTQINQYGNVPASRPHVVILGAGASRAALPDGDANGRRLPLMADFLEALPSVQEHLLEAGVEVDENDFKLTYGRMAKNCEHSALAATIETEIYNYFDAPRLPPTPTLYDHLMLALRKKDVIATFNWDPLLLQAARRCSSPGAEFPRLLFLHGNVLSGFCSTDEPGRDHRHSGRNRAQSLLA